MSNIAWLLASGTLLLAFCLYWGVATGRTSTRAEEFFLAGRATPAWIFVLSATALSLTGWLAIGHPSMLYLKGFSYGEVSLAAVVIPLAGILFLKRQWLLVQRYGYATPATMFGEHYQGELIRLLTVLIALVFAIPFVGLQLAAGGRLISLLTHGAVDAYAAMWILGFSVFVYVYLGGLRAVTATAVLQCLLMLAGMTGLGCLAYVELGGFGALSAALAKLGARPDETAAQLFQIPGVIQFTAGIGNEGPVGGVWTSSMILTYSLALMGIQASPAFSMLAFSCRDTRGFAPQQVWATGAVVGAVFLFFAIAYGLAGHLLSAPADVLASVGVAADTGGASYMDLGASFILSLAAERPWMSALLAMCVLSAIQVAAGAYVSTAAAMFSTDVYKRYFDRSADDRRLRVAARAALAVMFIVALLMGTYTPVAQAQLGTLALSLSLQLWPALAGVCWMPWITRPAATVGLCVGIFTVVLTEPVGGSILRFIGIELPWGRWPWTIYSAGWGIFMNVLACALVSFASRADERRLHRNESHAFLQLHAGMSTHKQSMKSAVWALVLIWAFFAIGPGSVIGNDVFGDPTGGLSAWKLGIPSLWAWQIIWWVLGVFVIWWLAYKMELSLPLSEPWMSAGGRVLSRHMADPGMRQAESTVNDRRN